MVAKAPRGRNIRRHGQAILNFHEEAIVMTFLAELKDYIIARRKWWLVPVLAALLIIGGLLVLAQGSAVAPFIYTIF